MPVLNKVAKIALKPLPRMISSRAHAAVDYVIVTSFLAAAATFWRRNKRAAVASLLCGGAKLAVTLLTDYPGGVRKAIPFGHRHEIDLGLAAMTATMPEFLAFKDRPEKNFFLAEGVLITAANELTRFPDESRARRRLRPAA